MDYTFCILWHSHSSTPSAHSKVVDYACCILWHSHFSTLCVVAFSKGLVYTLCIVTLSERTCTSSVQRECSVQWQGALMVHTGSDIIIQAIYCQNCPSAMA